MSDTFLEKLFNAEVATSIFSALTFFLILFIYCKGNFKR